MGAALAAVFLLLLLVGGQARALQPQYIGPCFRGIGAIILFAAAEGRKTGSRHLVRGRLCTLHRCLGLGAFNMDAARLDLWGDDCALKTNHQRAI
jgi:hypothetical protein